MTEISDQTPEQPAAQNTEPPAEASLESTVDASSGPTGGSASRVDAGLPRPTPAELSATATRVGGMLGRFARRALAAGEQVARDARPEAERLAKQARAAAEAARPHIERAGQDAVRYVREHDTEIKQAARTGARITAMRAVPAPFRPVVNALDLSQPGRIERVGDTAPAEPPLTTDVQPHADRPPPAL